ncbi:DUF3152 domain-containing protein [Streptomyces fulvorobeus]|uniref:DUF3152 domain-containing protein n=1 Tax=Streptomyces fulvorobeus TaxID=284028 RepID=A0A7Y9HF21_9ACTN|nr:hypothetical protein [Streptomyces fulvorobeus]
MGRHSRKGPEAKSQGGANAVGDPGTGPSRAAQAEAAPSGSGIGRRRRVAAVPSGGEGHTPFHGAPQVRGGHPEQREAGGGWGTGPQQWYDDRQGDGRTSAEREYAQKVVARQVSVQEAAQRAAERRTGPRRPAAAEEAVLPGPRKEFVDAFDGVPPVSPPTGPNASVSGGDDGGSLPDMGDGAAGGEGAGGGAGAAGAEVPGRGARGRTFTGIAAAAVTTVLAVVVAGQVAQDAGADRDIASRATGVDRGGGKDTSRSDFRPAPEPKVLQVRPLSYAQRMAKPYPLAPGLKASGKFEAVPGLAKAPGKGVKHRYRIDVEKGLALDSRLFADAVHSTLNDDRSWAHNGAMTFERISSGEADFVITLASPGTTGVWCAKSGLDTTQDNVSCDSAATERVMINAYRWAQGSSTFGPDALMAYRQMLINHEVGHRLGYGHVNCGTPGALAPVMQQQTKSLKIGGIECRPNPWAHPGS